MPFVANIFKFLNVLDFTYTLSSSPCIDGTDPKFVLEDDSKSWSRSTHDNPYWQVEFSKTLSIDSYVISSKVNEMNSFKSWSVYVKEHGNWKTTPSRVEENVDIFNNYMEFSIGKYHNIEGFRICPASENQDFSSQLFTYIELKGAIPDIKYSLNIVKAKDVDVNTSIFVGETEITVDKPYYKEEMNNRFVVPVYAQTKEMEKKWIIDFYGEMNNPTYTVDNSIIPNSFLQVYSVKVIKAKDVQCKIFVDGVEVTTEKPFYKEAINNQFTVCVFAESEFCHNLWFRDCPSDTCKPEFVIYDTMIPYECKPTYSITIIKGNDVSCQLFADGIEITTTNPYKRTEINSKFQVSVYAVNTGCEKSFVNSYSSDISNPSYTIINNMIPTTCVQPYSLTIIKGSDVKSQLFANIDNETLVEIKFGIPFYKSVLEETFTIRVSSKNEYCTVAIGLYEQYGNCVATRESPVYTITDNMIQNSCRPKYEMTIYNNEDFIGIKTQLGIYPIFKEITKAIPYPVENVNHEVSQKIIIQNKKCPDGYETDIVFSNNERNHKDFEIVKSDLPEECALYFIRIKKLPFKGQMRIRNGFDSIILSDDGQTEYYDYNYKPFFVNIFVTNDVCKTEQNVGKYTATEDNSYVYSIGIPDVCSQYAVDLLFPSPNTIFYIKEEDAYSIKDGQYIEKQNEPFAVAIYVKTHYCSYFSHLIDIKSAQKPNTYVVTAKDVPDKCLYSVRMRRKFPFSFIFLAIIIQIDFYL